MFEWIIIIEAIRNVAWVQDDATTGTGTCSLSKTILFFTFKQCYEYLRRFPVYPVIFSGIITGILMFHIIFCIFFTVQDLFVDNIIFLLIFRCQALPKTNCFAKRRSGQLVFWTMLSFKDISIIAFDINTSFRVSLDLSIYSEIIASLDGKCVDIWWSSV